MRSNAGSLRSWLLLLPLFAACDRGSGLEREFVALGTVVTISATDVSEPVFDAAADDLERHLLSIGVAWYPHSPGELRDLNAAIASGGSAVVSPALITLLEKAADYERRSGGRFNACIGRLSELWGFYELPEGPGEAPARAVLDALVQTRPGCRQLHIDHRTRTVSSTNRNVAVDVGGIAKGALLGDARRILLAHGIDDAIVNLGGDLLVTGQVDGRDARIGIRAPAGTTPMAGLDVRPGEAVVTSGNYERFVEIDGERHPHILDPATGRPVRHTASVSVVHSDATLADAAATALLVGGPDAFEELVAAFGLDYALLVDAKGDTRLTSAMAERVHWPDAGTDP